jgi:hypothetical protein
MLKIGIKIALEYCGAKGQFCVDSFVHHVGSVNALLRYAQHIDSSKICDALYSTRHTSYSTRHTVQ